MLDKAGLFDLAKGLNTGFAPSRKEVIGTARKAFLKLKGGNEEVRTELKSLAR